MKTFNQFLEQIGHTHQTSQQQVVARQANRFKITGHLDNVESGIRRASSYDEKQRRNIKDIEDRRS